MDNTGGINNMTEDKELDKWLAEKVMGWHLSQFKWNWKTEDEKHFLRGKSLQSCKKKKTNQDILLYL